MPSRACRTRVWDSLHEPKHLTMTAVALYTLMVILGVGVLALTLSRPATDTRDATLTALAVVSICTGTAGAPLAWTGRHYLEAAVVLGTPLIGLLIVADAAMVLADGGPVALPRIVLIAAIGGVSIALWGLGRLAFLRTVGPFAPGRGPLLPEHRIRVACEAMEQQEVEAAARAAARPPKED